MYGWYRATETTSVQTALFESGSLKGDSTERQDNPDGGIRWHGFTAEPFSDCLSSRVLFERF